MILALRMTRGNFPGAYASNVMSNLSGVQPGDDFVARATDAKPLGQGSPLRSSSPPPADSDLFRRAQKGDRGAFGQIVQLHQDRVYNAILRTIGDPDEALELTQETFAKALEKIESFRGESQPYTWLFRIALNLAITQIRKDGRRRTFSLDSTARSSAGGMESQAASLAERVVAQGSVGANPADIAQHREQGDQVVAALGRLEPEHRAILVMRDIEGFDYQQMADVLGLPLGTLKSKLFRARVALRDELKDYMEGNG